MDTSRQSSIFYLNAFQHPIISDLINLPHSQNSCPFIPPPLFDAIKPILAAAPYMGQESPLDLSSKLLANNSPIRHASVIQHTKSVAQNTNTVEMLPTCFQPKVDMHRLKKLASTSSLCDDDDQCTPRYSDESSSTQSTTNRMSYPREFKLMVIEYFFANGHNKYRTCKEFQITKSMLNGWILKADKIRLSAPGSLKSGRSGRKPQFPLIEKQLYELFSQELDKGTKIGNRWIRHMARMLAQQQCSSFDANSMCQFSERWLSNFKKRYKINLSRDNDTSGADSCSTSSQNEYDDFSLEKISDHENDQHVDITKNDNEHHSIIETGVDAQMTDNNNGPESNHLVQQILNQPGELPIQAFYKRFPWLCKRSQPTKEKGAEPNRRGRKVQFPEVERLLHERVLARVAGGNRISNKWLQQNAKEIAKLLDPSFRISSRFQFSDHWLHNFKKRYGLNLKTPKQGRMPEINQGSLNGCAPPQAWPRNEMVQVRFAPQTECRIQPVCMPIPMPHVDIEQQPMFVT